jgi:hypothetical protein
MPMGMPGWPLLAAWTASIDSARIALASSRRGGRRVAAIFSLLSAMNYRVWLGQAGRRLSLRGLKPRNLAGNRSVSQIRQLLQGID